MFAFWLAGALAFVGDAVSRTVATPVIPDLRDASEDDVKLMLGQPDEVHVVPWCKDAVWVWRRVDWLGGWRVGRVSFISGMADGQVTGYRLFARTPPWLDALRDAFGPRPVP